MNCDYSCFSWFDSAVKLPVSSCFLWNLNYSLLQFLLMTNNSFSINLRHEPHICSPPYLRSGDLGGGVPPWTRHHPVTGPMQRLTFTRSMGNLQSPVKLKPHVFGLREPEGTQEGTARTHSDLGQMMDCHPGPSAGEATVLTLAPQCCPASLSI